jgi:hypothetical protein
MFCTLGPEGKQEKGEAHYTLTLKQDGDSLQAENKVSN